jgi:imidazoleglycerol phosphate synthase glutamine amidotransferase subunit HisH
LIQGKCTVYDEKNDIYKTYTFIDGKVKKFDASKLKEKPLLPHMGWNSIEPLTDHELFKGVDKELGFYFLNNILYFYFYLYLFVFILFDEIYIGIGILFL